MDRVTLNGKSYRVEVNWNAIVAFLRASGRDDVRELMSLATLKPSDLSGLLAAAINEGERLEGRDCCMTAEEVGQVVDLTTMASFVGIFTDHISPKGQEPKKGKKV